jgi:UDP-N-acetyl-2-amino-2-deoxyglucuronate dehydrogenase
MSGSIKPTSKKLKFLLIGCGTIGERHAKLAAAIGTVIAVCDIIPERSRKFSKIFQCYGYTSLNEMLQQQPAADALIVCTPNGLHAAHSIAAFKKGLHVLCEKPMALTETEGKKMIAAASKAQRHLMIVKQNRYNPPVAAVKQLLDKNKLGQVYSIQINCFWNRRAGYYTHSNWRGTKKLDGGVLFTQFSHFIDLLYWYFGNLSSVNGSIANLAHQQICEVEDTGVFQFKTETGIYGTLNYTTNAALENYEGSLTIIAEKATIKIGGPYLNRFEYQKPVLIKQLAAGKKENKYKGYKGSMNNHAQVYKNFEAVLKGKKKNYTSGEEGIQSVKIIQQCYHAAAKKK